jgi:hypothetical protein
VRPPGTTEADSRSYRPGDWFGIFGRQVTVVLPPSEKARVAAIWAMVDDGAGFDEVLDALIAGGLRELPGFVLVCDDDGSTRVVIRGAATAEFTTDGETVTVEGSSATTWAERSLTGVRAMRIDVAGSEDGDDLAIRDGLVRIARTDRPAYVARQEPDPVPAQEPEAAPEDGAEDLAEDVAEEVAVVGAHDLAPDVNVMDQAALEPHAVSATEEAGWARPSEPPAAAVSAWAPPAPPEQAEAVLAAPVARLTFSSGEVVEVDRPVLVGRAPEVRRLSHLEQPRLVPVPSPHQEISSTHVEIRPGAGADHGSAVVTDLGSTNGTLLVQPGLPPEDLQPGIAVQLIPGAIIDLGDGVTIQVGNS